MRPPRRTLSRYALICVAAALLAVFVGTLATGPANAQIAADGEKFLGSTGAGTRTADPDPDFDEYWNQITPENAGKWRYTEPQRDVMDWDALDYWYDYAQERNIPFKQHTFVWQWQQPDWIDDLPPDQQRAEVEEWIRLYFQRYPDTDLVDVVNEPISLPADYRDALGGSGETGWDWVIWTFETAKQYRDQYAPDAKLLLNEHSILKNSGKMNDYLEIVDLLQERDLIDGIGLQAHFLEGTNPSTVSSHLDTVAARGLPVYISEFDLNISNDQQQRNKYEALFPIFWEHPSVKGVTLWGYKEGEIWRQNAYLLRSNGSERPALTWLRQYVQNNDPDEQPGFPRTGTRYGLQNVATGEYLDTGTNGNVDTDPGCCTTGQTWRFIQDSPGVYYIVNEAGGRGALDTSSNGVVRWTQSERPEGTDKLWRIEDAGDGTYRFRNERPDRGYLFEAGNGAVRWNTGGTGPETRWRPVVRGN